MPIPGSTKPTAGSNATRLLAMAKASPLPATAVTQHAKQTAATNTPSIVDLSPEQIGWDQWERGGNRKETERGHRRHA
jgi:hypothetical protein